MKKSLLTILGTMALVLPLAACGGGAGGEESSSSSSSEDEVTSSSSSSSSEEATPTVTSLVDILEWDTEGTTGLGGAPVLDGELVTIENSAVVIGKHGSTVTAYQVHGEYISDLLPIEINLADGVECELGNAYDFTGVVGSENGRIVINDATAVLDEDGDTSIYYWPDFNRDSYNITTRFMSGLMVGSGDSALQLKFGTLPEFPEGELTEDIEFEVYFPGEVYDKDTSIPVVIHHDTDPAAIEYLRVIFEGGTRTEKTSSGAQEVTYEPVTFDSILVWDMGKLYFDRFMKLQIDELECSYIYTTSLHEEDTPISQYLDETIEGGNYTFEFDISQFNTDSISQEDYINGADLPTTGTTTQSRSVNAFTPDSMHMNVGGENPLYYETIYVNNAENNTVDAYRQDSTGAWGLLGSYTAEDLGGVADYHMLTYSLNDLYGLTKRFEAVAGSDEYLINDAELKAYLAYIVGDCLGYVGDGQGNTVPMVTILSNLQVGATFTSNEELTFTLSGETVLVDRNNDVFGVSYDVTLKVTNVGTTTIIDPTANA